MYVIRMNELNLLAGYAIFDVLCRIKYPIVAFSELINNLLVKMKRIVLLILFLTTIVNCLGIEHGRRKKLKYKYFVPNITVNGTILHICKCTEMFLVKFSGQLVSSRSIL